MLDDVLVVLQRAEMTTRMAEEIERDCVELGSEGRLIRLQLEELFGDVPREKATVVRDYHVVGERADGEARSLELAACSYQELLGFEDLAEVLGYPRSVNPLDHSVAPRGYRVLSHIPRLAESVIRTRRRRFEGLDAIVRASHRELEAVEGVGPSRARGDPRGPAAAPGAQSGRPLPAAVEPTRASDSRTSRLLAASRVSASAAKMPGNGGIFVNFSYTTWPCRRARVRRLLADKAR